MVPRSSARIVARNCGADCPGRLEKVGGAWTWCIAGIPHHKSGRDIVGDIPPNVAGDVSSASGRIVWLSFRNRFVLYGIDISRPSPDSLPTISPDCLPILSSASASPRSRTASPIVPDRFHAYSCVFLPVSRQSQIIVSRLLTARYFAVIYRSVNGALPYRWRQAMINRSEVNRALAKAIAFKACGKDADASAWARQLVELLECADILN